MEKRISPAIQVVTPRVEISLEEFGDTQQANPEQLNPSNAATAEMTVERLGVVARAALGRGAEWAWSLGRAMQLAKIKFERDKAGDRA